MFSLVTFIPKPFVDTYQSFLLSLVVSLAEHLLALAFRISSASRSPLILEIISHDYSSIQSFIRRHAQPSSLFILFWLLNNWTQINAQGTMVVETGIYPPVRFSLWLQSQSTRFLTLFLHAQPFVFTRDLKFLFRYERRHCFPSPRCRSLFLFRFKRLNDLTLRAWRHDALIISHAL